MKIFFKASFIIVLFACSFLKSEAKGRDVIIFFKDGTKQYGELIAVQDSVIISTQAFIDEDKDIIEAVEALNIAFIKDITLIDILEEPCDDFFGVAGAGIGLITGVGAIAATKNWAYIIDVPAITTIIGGAIGIGIGELLSGKAEALYPSKEDILVKIKQHSRFQESEPPYLRDIIDNLLKETK